MVLALRSGSFLRCQTLKQPCVNFTNVSANGTGRFISRIAAIVIFYFIAAAPAARTRYHVAGRRDAPRSSIEVMCICDVYRSDGTINFTVIVCLK